MNINNDKNDVDEHWNDLFSWVFAVMWRSVYIGSMHGEMNGSIARATKIYVILFVQIWIKVYKKSYTFEIMIINRLKDPSEMK